MKKKFEWRGLFPMCYYRYKRDLEFNGFVFYVDMLIWYVFLCVLGMCALEIF